MFGFWHRLRLAWEHARLTVESQRLKKELRAVWWSKELGTHACSVE